MADLNLNKKILIVEDDKDFLWILRQSFISEGFSVVYALDGPEGLELAKKEKPDLVLLDILMPTMDGITMAKKLRESEPDVRIIFLTNLAGAENINKAIEIDKSDYIVKSETHVNEIVARVKDRLGLK